MGYVETYARLQAEGKVHDLSSEDIQAVLDMNERMAEVRREYRLKEFKSEQSARNVILGPNNYSSQQAVYKQ